MTNQSSIEPSFEFNPQIESLLVRAHSLAAFATLLLAVCFGILVSLQFVFPDSLGAFPSWGRMRYAHTQGIMLGWLGNAFIAFMYLCSVADQSLADPWASCCSRYGISR